MALPVVEITENLRNIVNTKNSRGQTPLFLAIRRQNLDMISLLLRAGAKFNIKNDDNSTVFHGLAFELTDGLFEAAHIKGAEEHFFKFISKLLDRFPRGVTFEELCKIFNERKNEQEGTIYDFFKIDLTGGKIINLTNVIKKYTQLKQKHINKK